MIGASAVNVKGGQEDAFLEAFVADALAAVAIRGVFSAGRTAGQRDLEVRLMIYGRTISVECDSSELADSFDKILKQCEHDIRLAATLARLAEEIDDQEWETL